MQTILARQESLVFVDPSADPLHPLKTIRQSQSTLTSDSAPESFAGKLFWQPSVVIALTDLQQRAAFLHAMKVDIEACDKELSLLADRRFALICFFGNGTP